MDQLLKMDYEERAKHLKKMIPRNQVKGREFSQSVRAANSNFEKSYEKTVNRVNHESRLFHLKFSRSCDNLQTFKQGIERKSLHFSENAFQESASADKANCHITNKWFQCPPCKNVWTAKAPKSMTPKDFRYVTGCKTMYMSHTGNDSTIANFSITQARIAGLALQDKQKPDISRKPLGLHDFSERNLNRSGRSYRRLREKFTAINHPPPDVRLLKRSSFHEGELQRSSELKQMVKKLCEDIEHKQK